MKTLQNKTYIKDMDIDKLWDMVEHCGKLREMVSEDVYDNAMFWTDEALSFFEHNGRTYLDYEIGGYGASYIHVDNEDYEQFLRDVKSLNQAMEVVYPHDDIDKLSKCIDRYEDARYGVYDMSDKNWQMLSDHVDGLIDNITDAMLKYFMSDFDSVNDDDTLKDYLDCFVLNHGDTLYVEDGALFRERSDELLAEL